MNKKKLITVAFGFLIVIGLVIALFGFNKPAVLYAEETYLENPNDKNLYELCKIAFADKENKYILNYFPQMIKNENFDTFIEKDVTKEISEVDLKNIYIDTYLYTCYQEYTYEKFTSEFIEFFPYFVYQKDSASDYTQYLQIHFWNDFAVDKELTKAYCDVLKIIYKNDRLPYDVRTDGYQFILEWYGQIGDMDSFNEIKKIQEKREG